MMQIVTMVNYYLRLKAGESGTAQQVEFDPLSGSFRATTSVTGVGSGIGNANVVVAGHSLGGYLSTIFGYLFGTTTTSVFTYNAPGSWGVEATIRNLAVLLGNTNPTYSSDRQTNLIGDYLVSSVPGHRGSDLRVFEEGNSHSQKVLTDSLAIYNLLAKLDPSLTPSAIDTILKASTAIDADSLEQVLDAVRKIILGTGISSTKIMGTADTQTTREALYANLYNLQGNGTFKTIAGKAKIESLSSSGADTLSTLARTDFASLLSLLTLSPFTLKAVAGKESEVETALKANWSAEYSDWEADQALTPAQRDAGQGNYTKQYLADRAAFLAGITQANTDNTGTGKALTVDISSVRGHDYEDKASGLTLREINTLSVETNLKVAFGGSENDTLWGSDLADHLYGGAGSDRLDGGKGDDYLEGNAGSDNFTGGKGNDTLLGGAGLDIYTINDGDGWDTIEDSDGAGAVYYGSQQLTGGTAVGDSGMVWQQKVGDKTYTYILTDWTEGGETYKRLSIQGPDGGVFIKNWAAGQLGIKLEDATPPPAINKNVINALPDTPPYFTEGTGGDDKIIGGDWVDRIYASGGNDTLIDGGNATFDMLDGQGGDDRLEMSGGRDIGRGREGNDTLIVRKVDGGPVADDVFLDGGLDADQLVGSNGKDLLLGGRGRDTLIGGEGGDWLEGDMSATQVNGDWAWAAPDAQGHFGVTNWWFNTSDGTQVASATPGYYTSQTADVGEDDLLIGEGGNDYIQGGAGNDILLGGAGDDHAHGGKGNDYLDVGADNDEASGNDGKDTLEGGAGADKLWGNASDDLLYGGIGHDKLAGDDFTTEGQFHGKDSLDGGEGNDTLWGNGQDDTLYGGIGNDELQGDSLSSQLDGQYHGNDFLDGGIGNDALMGEGGNDTVLGGADDDILYGDAGEGDALAAAYEGNDYLDGGSGADSLYGKGGNDTLIGGAGRDYLAGGEGDDYYQIGAAEAAIEGGMLESIDDTAGNNRLQLDVAPGALSVRRSGSDLTLYWNNDTQGLYIKGGLSGSIKEYTLGDQKLSWIQLLNKYLKDSINSSSTTSAATLVGGALTDTLQASGGGSTFHGGQGNDSMTGSGGNNTYVYNLGDGQDRISDTGSKVGASGVPTPNTLQFGSGITAAMPPIDRFSFGGGAQLSLISDAGNLIMMVVIDRNKQHSCIYDKYAINIIDEPATSAVNQNWRQAA